MRDLRAHNDSEETIDLPKLEASVGPLVSQAVAKKFQNTKMLVPTRLVFYSSK